MNLASNVILGWLSLYWYTILYSNLFDYLFINVSLEPVIGPCREAYGVDSCRPLARVFLWLMELPINVVSVGSFALAIVVLEKYIEKIQLKYKWLVFGVLTGYVILSLWAPFGPVHFSYHLVFMSTYAFLMVVGVWGCKHLTSAGM